jgi:3-oxoacyl-[acyl-carrier protein] reductase
MAAPADCANLQAVQAMREKVESTLGEPELLLPFAGGGGSKPMPFVEIAEQDWRSSLDQNLTSTFFVLQCFLPALLARGSGAIVTMASAGGRIAAGAPVAYGAAKAGVIMLTRHLASEMGPQGIRVNCISPSAVLTERTASRIPPERQQQMLAAFPLGRLGQPEDIAAAALFLLSSASAWITGATLDVAGGRIMS